MMQVTGSNSSPYVYNAKLSIRLRQDGQFCSLDEALAQTSAAGTTVDVMVDGAVCLPFPRKEEERIDLRALLADAGMPVAENDGVVVCSTDSPVAYALWIEQGSYESLQEWAERCGVKLNYCAPLAEVVARAVVGSRHDKCVVLSRSNDTLYLAYTDSRRLLYAEALPNGSDEDMVYALAVLNGDFELRRADIIIIGADAKRDYKVLRRYFRRCKCE